MTITKLDPITGKTNTQDLPITPAQLQAWNHGALIQHVMPHLTVDQREFLMTGMMPESWESLFPEDGEDR